MKKIAFLLPLIALNAIGLSGCKSSPKSRITYGTYVDTTATELTYSAFVNHVTSDETMLIAVYDDYSSVPCGCWLAFKAVLNEYVDTYDTKVYYIARSQFSDDSERYGLTILEDGTQPTFALIKNQKRVKEYIYGNSNKPMFESLDGLRSVVTRIARDPEFYYVDQAYLDNALFTTKENVIILYVWNSCDDCKDCLPNVMFPYAENNDCSKKVWVIDLDVPGLLQDENGNKDKTREEYVTFLKDHHVSDKLDTVFGYDRGFVPSIQVWENGELKDMNVYFNDAYEQVDGVWKITRSYYTEERVQHLKYTNTVLQDMVIPNSEISEVEYQGIIYRIWSKESARSYHKPILEAFLDMYVK